MQKFRFENNFYNGNITPYATSYIATEYNIINHQIYVTVEYEYYNTETDNPELETLVGTALLSDLIFEYDYEDFLFDLYDMANCFETQYRPEFFIDEVPHCLATKKFVCNSKTYTLGNIHIKDETFTNLCDIIDQQTSIISAPLKLLKSILSNAPFDKQINN